ncbi:MAG: SPASM domain-containing protein [Clostridia bacterium]|nr:SPASM domain-containing protein [Clostridia bacterium]
MISFLIKPSSSLCNMSCSYCFYCDEAKNRENASLGFMKKETAENIIKKAAEISKEAMFVFQGGEPLLAGVEFYKDFAEMCKGYGLKAHYSIQTNGTLIDEEFIRFFKENNVLLGVSLDGVEEVHNSLRKTADGKPTFKTVFDNIKLLQKNEIEFNILTVITPEVVKHTEEIYRFYMENGFYCQQYIPCIDEINSSQRALSNSEYADFLKRLFTLYFNDKRRGVPVSVRYFDNLLMKLNGMPAEQCGMNGICTVQLVIEGDGTVYPCDFYCIDGYDLGNINTHSLDEILNSSKAKSFLNDNQTAHKCKECEFFRICAGGCKRYRADGLNDFCEAYKEFFEFSMR